MRELITIQLGHESNFVGTHYWNTSAMYYQLNQESLFDQETLYRLSELQNEPTFTPRLLIVDLKGSLGGWNPTDMMDQQEHIAWDGKITKVQQDQIQKTEFLNSLNEMNVEEKGYTESLTNQVKVWTDYQAQYLHPNTVYELDSYRYGDELNPFSYFNQGMEEANHPDFVSQVMEDRIRLLVEESDSAQGFQIFTDINDGYSGLASFMVEQLLEEYGKKGIMMFGIGAGTPITQSEQWIKKLNQCLILNSMYESGSMYVPLYTPGPKSKTWCMNPVFENRYQSSAYLSSAIESITLPLRLKGTNRLDIQDLQYSLYSGTSRGIYSLSMGIPQIKYDTVFELNIKGHVLPWCHNLTFQTQQLITKQVNQFTLFRGLSHMMQRQLFPIGGRPQCETIQRDIQNVFTTECQRSQIEFIDVMVPVSPSFPNYFTNMDSDGFYVTKSAHVNQYCMMTTLQNGAIMDPYFQSMIYNVKHTSQDNMILSDFKKGDFGVEDWQQISQQLEALVTE